AIAQLGERLDRTQEVAGSSPASSTSEGVLKVRDFVSSASTLVIPGHDDALLALVEHAGELTARVITSPLAMCRIARSTRATHDGHRARRGRCSSGTAQRSPE